jgi:G3E family GTPase
LDLASDRSRFDVIVVESSGISEPLPVAEVFEFAQESTGRRLSDFARLDTTVTCVDAFNFPRDFGSADSLEARRVAAYAGDPRCLVDLLTDQVEFADVLVLNKADLVAPQELAATTALLRRLNPAARILPAVRAAVPLASILATGTFSMARARAAPGWLQELRGAHVPETLEYGISSFIFRAKRPFHAARLYALIAAGKGGALGCVVRSKGFAWLAVDGGMDEVALWASAGRVWQLSQGRAWWATVAQREWPEGLRELLGAPGGAEGGPAAAAASAAGAPGAEGQQQQAGPRRGVWDPTYGDRGSEIVFIGQGLVEGEVRSALQATLVTDEEFAQGRDLWDASEDPFDFFPYEDELDDEEEEGEGEGEEVEGGGHTHNGVPCTGHHHEGEEGEEKRPEKRPTTCRIVVE